MGFIASGLLDPIQYLFPDYAQDYARYTAESAECAQETLNDLSSGFFPRTLGCQPSVFRLKLAAIMAVTGILPSFLYLLFTPLYQSKAKGFWNKNKPWLSVLTLLIPLLSLLSPVINVLDAFELTSGAYIAPFDRPIIPSVAVYSSLNLLYLLGVFLAHRSHVLAGEK